MIYFNKIIGNPKFQMNTIKNNCSISHFSRIVLNYTINIHCNEFYCYANNRKNVFIVLRASAAPLIFLSRITITVSRRCCSDKLLVIKVHIKSNILLRNARCSHTLIFIFYICVSLWAVKYPC